MYEGGKRFCFQVGREGGSQGQGIGCPWRVINPRQDGLCLQIGHAEIVGAAARGHHGQ
jgi:hypothetical protein